MNISELINIIKDIAVQQMQVHSSFDGDVYENWDSKEIKYGSVNVALQSITYDGNLCTYSLILYYGDRLLQDKKNVNLIYSDGVVALQSIINTLEAEYGVDIPQSVIYTPFEQKFADYLAGVYATFDVVTESELGYCSIAEMEMDEYSDSNSESNSDNV